MLCYVILCCTILYYIISNYVVRNYVLVCYDISHAYQVNGNLSVSRGFGDKAGYVRGMWVWESLAQGDGNNHLGNSRP